MVEVSALRAPVEVVSRMPRAVSLLVRPMTLSDADRAAWVPDRCAFCGHVLATGELVHVNGDGIKARLDVVETALSDAEAERDAARPVVDAAMAYYAARMEWASQDALPDDHDEPIEVTDAEERIMAACDALALHRERRPADLEEAVRHITESTSSVSEQDLTIEIDKMVKKVRDERRPAEEGG